MTKCFFKPEQVPHIGGLPKTLRMIFLMFFPLLLVFASPLRANNVSVENVSLAEQDSSSDTIQVEFDISWDNAWSDSVNHDSVWVFVKYCTSSCTGSATWNHATLETAGTNPSGISHGTKQSGSVFSTNEIVVPSDKKGAFIDPGHLYNGTGTFDFHDVQLVWDYGNDGISDAVASNGTLQVKVFAIEMVYIPEGGFIAGDTASTSTTGFESGTGSSNVLPAVNSEGGISFRSSSASDEFWYYNTDNNANDAASGASFDVSEAWPKGYQAFYLMKHEVSQGLYTAFLNVLTSTQDTNRYPSQSLNRHTIAGSAGGRTSTRPARACNFLKWMDLAAFADWAALRPMTELEFEKAARGPLSPVSAEYAWGTTSKTDCAAISGTEDGTETCSTTSSNATFGNATFTGGDLGSGPTRVGIYSTASSTTRVLSGSGYYGNLDLTGNVSEMIVHLGNATGRGFSGSHGDGELNTNGYATNPDWPGYVSGSGVTGAAGSGERGGSWADTTTTRGTISDRYDAADEVSTAVNDRGGRAARTAP